MSGALTEIERKILDYMVQYLRANTFQPSIREIGERFQIKSTKTVSEHLRALADKGYLERDPARSRGVRIVGEDLNAQTVSVPCYSELPTDPSGRGSRVEEYYSMDRRMAGAKGAYFVRARAGQLPSLGVNEGDFLMVEPAGREQIGDGDVVVTRMGGGPGFYRYERRGRSVLLRPGRLDEEPVVVEDPHRIQVEGKVTALFRRMDGSSVPMSATAH